MSSFSLPENYGLVVAAGAFCGIIVQITTGLAGSKRKELGVELPNLYASDEVAKRDPKAHLFNCSQRGAMNPLETLPTALFGLATGGLSYPLVAAGAGFAFGVGALLFYFGYASGKPEQRYSKGGLIMRAGTAVLTVLPLVTAYQLLTKQ